MAIRKANQKETEKLIRLCGKVMKESTMGYAENNIQTGYNLFLPILQNGAYFLVDEENGKLRGWILLGKDWNMFTNEAIGHLLSVYVFPDYRKAGVARLLTQSAIQELKAQGIHIIQLNVFDGNPSRIICEQLGFKEISATLELRLDQT